MEAKKVLFNWSGGKDSSLALYHLKKDKTFEITSLMTSISAEYNRISMHGVRKELLLEQGKAIGLPIKELLLPASPSMSEYDAIMKTVMTEVKTEGITHSAFGDIFLEDLKRYREERLAEVGLKALFPIWKRDTTELVKEFIDYGFKTIVVCVKGDVLDESFAGRVIDHDFIADLPKGVDPCGENGEFHTFAFDGPIFDYSIPFDIGDTVFREYKAPKDSDDSCLLADGAQKMSGYYFKDLLPINSDSI